MGGGREETSSGAARKGERAVLDYRDLGTLLDRGGTKTGWVVSADELTSSSCCLRLASQTGSFKQIYPIGGGNDKREEPPQTHTLRE